LTSIKHWLSRRRLVEIQHRSARRTFVKHSE